MRESARIHLERRIDEERMTPINVGDGQHDTLVWHFDGGRQPRAWTMDASGAVAAQCLLDEVDWHGVVAVRLENAFGLDVDVEYILSDDFGEVAW